MEDADMLKDFAKWRKDLEREGFFKPSPAHVATDSRNSRPCSRSDGVDMRSMARPPVFVTACFFFARGAVGCNTRVVTAR